MPHLAVLALAPLVPLACLGLVLYMDHLEETLNRDVRRRQHDSRERMSAENEETPAVPAAVSAPVVGSTSR